MSDVYMEALQAHNEQRFDEAELLYRQSLVFADQNNNSPLIALTMHQLGRLSFEQGDLHRAMRRFKKLLSWQNAHNDSRGQSRTCRQIAAIFDYRGDSIEALQWGQKALRFAESVWSRHNMAEAYMLLGLLFFRERRLTEAVSNMRASQEVWSELKDDDGFYRVSYRLAQLLIQRGDLVAAIREYCKCLEILQQDELEEAADIHQQVALLSLEAGLLGEAITHSLAALGRNRKLQAVELHDNVGVLLQVEEALGESSFWSQIAKHLDETGVKVVRSIIDSHRANWEAISIDEPETPFESEGIDDVVESNSSQRQESAQTSVNIEQTHVPIPKTLGHNLSDSTSEDDSAERVPEPKQIAPVSQHDDKTEVTERAVAVGAPILDEFPSVDEQTDETIYPSQSEVSAELMTEAASVSVDLDSSPSIDQEAVYSQDIPSYIHENPVIYTDEPSDEFTEDLTLHEQKLQSEASREFIVQFVYMVLGAFALAIVVLMSLIWLWEAITA